jgi:hypothetical protein
MYAKACYLAFLTMEWLTAPSEGHEFSASRAVSFLLDEIEIGHFKRKGASDRQVEEVPRPNPSHLIMEFPIVKVLHLPFVEVLKVRDLPLFRTSSDRFG